MWIGFEVFGRSEVSDSWVFDEAVGADADAMEDRELQGSIVFKVLPAGEVTVGVALVTCIGCCGGGVGGDGAAGDGTDNGFKTSISIEYKVSTSYLSLSS